MPIVLLSLLFILGPEQRISPSSNVQEMPAIASAGSGDSLVTWLETSSNASFIMAMPLRDGVPASNHPISLGIANSSPAIASDGTQYLIAWATPSGFLVAQRLDRTGAPVDPQPFVIASTVYEPAAIAFDGESFLVVHHVLSTCRLFPTPSFFVSRFSRSGQLLGPPSLLPGVVSCSYETAFASGSNGSLLVIPTISDVVAIFIPRGGVPGQPIKLSSDRSLFGVRLAWTGNRFVAAGLIPTMTSARGVEWLSFSESGFPLWRGFRPQALPPATLASAFAGMRHGAFLVWGVENDLFGLRFSADGDAAGDPFVISRFETALTNVAVAEDRDGRVQIVSQRMSQIFVESIEFDATARSRASRIHN